MDDDLRLMIPYEFQAATLLTTLFYSTTIITSFIEKDDKHKLIRTIEIDSVLWREYPAWILKYNYTKSLFITSILTCTCKEAYNNIKIWFNPYRLTQLKKIQIIANFELFNYGSVKPINTVIQNQHPSNDDDDDDVDYSNYIDINNDNDDVTNQYWMDDI